jgi:hypothetical protein
MKHLACALAALFVPACATTAAGPPFAAQAQPGVTRYHYELVEHISNQPDKGYRLDYDLAVGRDHGVVAIVHHASELTAGASHDVSVDPACAQALHARSGELARVTLWPLDPAAATAMNESFMAMCAPAAIFYPITDILNVVLVQSSDRFKLATLRRPGDQARFEGYSTHFSRLGAIVQVSAQGGSTTLTSFDPHNVVVDWASDPMSINIIHLADSASPEVHLGGVENFAFRLQIDPRTGIVQNATATHDELNLVVAIPGMAPSLAPRLQITRAVTIARLP